MKVILASGSPRRKELLQMIFSQFDIIPSGIEEVLPNGLDVEKGPQYLAAQKARDVSVQYCLAHPEEEPPLVIGCDTGVFLDNQMLGKPRDREDASAMIHALSGRTHRVITGCCLICGDSEYAFSDLTVVEFYPLTEGEIASWLNLNEYLDKAGAYAIQGKGGLMIQGIQGDYYNVMGLPAARLAREIIHFLNGCISE